MSLSLTRKCQACNGFGYIKYESWICDDCRGRGTVIQKFIDANEHLCLQTKYDNILNRLCNFLGWLQENPVEGSTDLIIDQLKSEFPELKDL